MNIYNNTQTNSRNKRLIWIFAIGAILSQLIYLFFGTDWFYPLLYNIDSYVDLLFAFHYDFNGYGESYYRAARVSWVAVLHYIQKITSPNNLPMVVGLTTSIILPLLYFILLKNIFDLNRAFLILPFIIFYPTLHGQSAGGYFYANTGAVIYMLLSLIIWSNAALEKRQFLRWCLSGFLFASAVISHILFLNLIALFPVINFFKNRKNGIRPYLVFSIGLAQSFCFWGFVNFIHDRSFMFFQETINIFLSLARNSRYHEIWWVNTLDLLRMSLMDINHLLFPTTITILCFLKILFNKNWKQSIHLSFAVLFFCYGIGWLLLHSFGQTALYPPDFSYLLQIPMILAVTSLLPQKKNSQPDFLNFSRLTLALLTTNIFSSDIQKWHLSINWVTPIYWNLGLASISVIFYFSFYKFKFIKILSLVMIVIVYSTINYEYKKYTEANCTYRRDDYLTFTKIIENLNTIDTAPENFYILYDIKDSRSISSACNPQASRINSLRLGKTLNIIYLNRLTQSYQPKTINNLEPADFRTFLINKNAKLILLNSDNVSFVTAIVEKLKTFNIALRLIRQFPPIGFQNKIQYSVYEYDLVSSR